MFVILTTMRICLKIIHKSNRLFLPGMKLNLKIGKGIVFPFFNRQLEYTYVCNSSYCCDISTTGNRKLSLQGTIESALLLVSAVFCSSSNTIKYILLFIVIHVHEWIETLDSTSKGL